MSSDKELVAEIANGSSAAMEVLTRRYYKSVFSFIYRKVGHKQTAYDLTQEVFIKMLKQIRTYTDKGEFLSWLLTIAANHCTDYFRSRAYKQRTAETELKEQGEDPAQNVSFIFERNEQRETVKRAVAGLPDNQRDVVLLRYYHDLTYEQISQMQNAPVSTVKSRAKRAMDLLRKSLRRELDDYEDRSYHS